MIRQGNVMRRRWVAALATVTVASAAAAATPSVAAADCTASAFINDRYNEWVLWKGNAVGCLASRTYSWRIRLYHNGNEIDEHILENKSGSTHYSTPSYENFQFGPVKNAGYCTRFFIYHSRTVGNNRVDWDEDCM
jgi:hypothetical protein